MNRCIVALSALALAATAPANGASLTIGVQASPSSMDPHYHYVGQNTGPLSQVFEPLIAQKPDFSLGPQLATAWRAVDDTTWEVTLRPGVRFHDGSPFTAEDALFSLRRVPLVPNSPNSFALYTKNIASLTVVDPLTLRIGTKQPEAEFPVGLSQILILSHVAAAGPAPEGKTTQQFNAGDGMVGTGPYRFTSFVPNDRMIVTRNPDYWGQTPRWDSVAMRVIPDDAARAAAMLAGDLDVTEVPGETLAPLTADPRIRVTQGPSCFVTYLALDQHDISPKVTGTGGKNPMQDARVRKALSISINRAAIAARVMSGLADAAAELGPTTLFGARPDAQPDAFNPEAARALLAEAGYPTGFGLTLTTPTGLFPRDVQIAQAIASMWTRVGIKTEVDAVPGTVFYSRRNKLEVQRLHDEHVRL